MRREELCEGMILAEALMAPDGRELAPAGAALGARHLRALELWDVVSVDVDIHSDAAAGPDAAPLPERLRLSDPNHPAVRWVGRIAAERAQRGERS